jgi:hypothetical protein
VVVLAVSLYVNYLVVLVVVVLLYAFDYRENTHTHELAFYCRCALQRLIVLMSPVKLQKKCLIRSTNKRETC